VLCSPSATEPRNERDDWSRDDASGWSSGTGVLAPPAPPETVRRGHPRERAPEPPPPPPPDRHDGGGGGGGGGDGGDGDGFGEGSEPGPRPTPPGAARFALALSLIGIATLFGVFLATWLLLRRGEDDPMRWAPFLPPRVLWLSTLVLALSSVALERAARTPLPVRNRARAWVLGGLVLGLGFLGAQTWLWWELVGAGLIPSSGAYGAIFYALTGLHALHVLGGLVAMLATHGRLGAGTLGVDGLRLCATYWHFMGLLWLVIFVVLTFLR